MSVQRTLVVLKPDALERSLAGRIMQRFEEAGLKIVASKMVRMDAEFTRKHYFDLAERRGEEAYTATAALMQSGPVLALVLEGAEAVANVRRLVGVTFPSEAAPGTIRGDFAHQSQASTSAAGQAVANLVHASGNLEEAKYEVELWFSSEELYEYEILAQKYTF